MEMHNIHVHVIRTVINSMQRSMNLSLRSKLRPQSCACFASVSKRCFVQIVGEHKRRTRALTMQMNLLTLQLNSFQKAALSSESANKKIFASKNGIEVPCLQSTSKFIQDCPSGPYTVMVWLRCNSFDHNSIQGKSLEM